jgi:hypothetical protein
VTDDVARVRDSHPGILLVAGSQPVGPDGVLVLTYLPA